MLGILIVVIVLVAVAAWLITIYNRLILLKNRFQNAFAQIDVQLKRRHDLIPNLVETAKREALWKEANYHIISMKNDFKTIYGDGVKKVDFVY